MSDVLGLIGMVVFVLVIVALAAAVTWVVVKFSPTKSYTADSGKTSSSGA